MMMMNDVWTWMVQFNERGHGSDQKSKSEIEILARRRICLAGVESDIHLEQFIRAPEKALKWALTK